VVELGADDAGRALATQVVGEDQSAEGSPAEG
jgi:hypothetical protein